MLITSSGAGGQGGLFEGPDVEAGDPGWPRASEGRLEDDVTTVACRIQDTGTREIRVLLSSRLSPTPLCLAEAERRSRRVAPACPFSSKSVSVSKNELEPHLFADFFFLNP